MVKSLTLYFAPVRSNNTQININNEHIKYVIFKNDRFHLPRDCW